MLYLVREPTSQGMSSSPRRDTEDYREKLLWRRPVPRELDGLVERFMGYREDGTAFTGDVEMAALVVPIIISFGEPFTIGLGRPPQPADSFGSFIAGLYPGPVVISSSGRSECVQIDLTPPGAARFFGMPMSELANRMIPLDDFGDGEISLLRRQLADESDWHRRLALVERFTVERMQRNRPVDAAVAWAYGTMLAAGGNLRVGRIAERLDWSRKHFSQRFQAAIGLTPKAVARMVRFRAVLDMAGNGSEAQWADIAAACGYADQAHLSREFAEFSGTTPAAWLGKAA